MTAAPLLPRVEAEALLREGIEALRRGDGTTARTRIDTAIAAGTLVEQPWLMLAQACRLTGDTAAEIAALEAVLAVQPRHLAALLMMGDARLRAGDDRAATSFFRTALNVVAVTEAVAPALHPLIRTAEIFLAEANRRFEAHLHATLTASGLTPSGRTAQAIDLLLGRTQLYLQNPTSFYYPGLAQRQFFEREEFDWLGAVEAAVPAMRAELDAVLADTPAFDPYVASSAERPRPANHLLDDPAWGAFYFWQFGERVADHADRCPATMAALANAPMPVIDRRSPMALWSRLEPGTHIRPHHGLINTRLIVHVPLIVPEGCAIRVGSETRAWQEGRALIFDDSFEHEAWNRGSATRVILLFEIWRPELAEEERAALTRIFASINDYTGVPVDAG